MENNYNTYKLTYPSPIHIDIHTNKMYRNSMSYYHYHTHYEFFFVSSGTAEFIFETSGKSVLLNKGDVLIIPPYEKHMSIYNVSKETFRLEIAVSPNILDDYYKSLLAPFSSASVLFVPLRHQNNVYSLINSLNREITNSDKYSSKLSMLYLHELLILLARNGVKSSSRSHSEEKTIAAQVMDYVNTNYSGINLVSEIAQQLHISERTLFQNFKKQTSLTVKDYINSVKILNAEKLLSESDYSVSEISEMVGFNDSNYFSTVFKKYKGVSPKSFRYKAKKATPPPHNFKQKNTPL